MLEWLFMSDLLVSFDAKYPNRWKKGVSGNPTGRKKTDVKVRELARQNTEAAIHALLEIVLDQKAKPRTRMSAAKIILDRAWERPRHFDDSKKVSIKEYVNLVYAKAYGFSEELTVHLRRLDKNERELDAVIEQAERSE